MDSFFSSRNKYASAGPIVEDAPRWLRDVFVSQFFDGLYSLLTFKGIYETFCVLAKQSPRLLNGSDSQYRDHLAELLTTCDWYNFYDLVELFASRLKPHPQNAFSGYREKVNALFAAANIGWRLDEAGRLVREILPVLENIVGDVRKGLALEFEPAADHYEKAHYFLYGRPSDPENAIKEIVSTVESVGKVLYPGTGTLGNVVKAMRSDQRIYPGLLVSMIEKFYAYASAEPAVRHGSAVSSRVSEIDAEFCFITGIGLIKYLLETKKSKTLVAEIIG